MNQNTESAHQEYTRSTHQDKPTESTKEGSRVIIAALRRYRATNGSVPNALVREACVLTGYTQQHVRRLIKSGFSTGRPAFTPTTEHLDAFYQSHGNAARAIELCRTNGSPVPVGLRQFQRGLAERTDQTIRHGAREGWSGLVETQPYLPRHIPRKGYSYAIDHTMPPVLIQPDKAGDKPQLLWETTVLDESARFELVVYVSNSAPDVQTTVGALAAAAEGYEADDGTWLGGMPEHVLSDNGADLRSHAATRGLVRAGVSRQFTAVRSGFQNGRVERKQRTVQQEWCSTLPGYLPEGLPEYDRKQLVEYYRQNPELLLTRDNYDAMRQREQIRYNYERKHSQLGGKTPFEAWSADQAVIPRPDPQALRMALMSSQERVVDHSRVRIFNDSYYSDNGLLSDHNGHRVEVRFLPGNRHHVEIFYNDDWVCRAYASKDLPDSARTATLDKRTTKRTEFLARSAAGEKLAADRARKMLTDIGFEDRDLPAAPAEGQSVWSSRDPDRARKKREGLQATAARTAKESRNRPVSVPETNALLNQLIDEERIAEGETT